ncbi:hypothetical protein OAM66_00435 [Pelagibacteraceae bacterium]|jgi:hypothetical protein|nr:hypothetical protein [Pelagibacteraceae bacterium]|tara:strand:+ start:1099 stop:1677 length:579 start_codon:yes stop_codon:yes gene_type:complete
MKFILVILLLFVNNCVPKQEVYLCGNKECLNKKDTREYFKKNLSIQVKMNKTINDKNVDLIELNKSSLNSTKKNVRKIDNQNNYLTRSEKNAEKKAQKLKKKLAKKEKKIALRQAKLDKKNILQNDKIKKKNDNKFFNIFNKKKVVSKISRDNINQENNFCIIENKCNIEEISLHINSIGRNKPYPDISNNN